VGFIIFSEILFQVLYVFLEPGWPIES
jgi:hypothetical protein